MKPSHIKVLFTTCVVVLFSTLSIAASAQSAQEIVARHIEALGGKEKLQSINSLFIQGVAVTGNGTEIATKLWKVYDRLFRQEVSFGADSAVTIVTPGRGWYAGPRSNGAFKSMPSNQLKVLLPQIDPAGPLADYAAKGCKVELAGKDTIAGKPCYRIRLSCPMGQSVTYSIDAATYYILREAHKGGFAEQISTEGGGNAGEFYVEFSNYKKTSDGYVFPYTVMTSGMAAKMNVEKVEVNRNINVDSLSRPK
jgi:hypothetical protein